MKIPEVLAHPIDAYRSNPPAAILGVGSIGFAGYIASVASIERPLGYVTAMAFSGAASIYTLRVEHSATRRKKIEENIGELGIKFSYANEELDSWEGRQVVLAAFKNTGHEDEFGTIISAREQEGHELRDRWLPNF